MSRLLPARMIKSLMIVAALTISGLAAPSQAGAFNNQQAANFLSNLQETAAAQLGDNSASEQQKEERFRKLFNESFDVPAIGRFVVGRYWRGASEADRAAFLDVFEDVMVQRFLPLLTENTDERFQIGAITPDSRNPDMAIIASQIPRAEGEPYKVGWRIREKGDQYRILDIVAEGVSMVITLRSEYATVLKRSGGKVTELTSALREKVSGGAFAPQQ